MDEEKRRKAQRKIEYAKDLDRKRAPKEEIIDEYWKGINLLLQIEKKQVDDFTTLSDIYSRLAIIYFNVLDYAKASQCYSDSINQLLQTELTDPTYRQLTELYIDLADACYELFNQPAGDEAMNNAIKAFKLIKMKNSKEKEIGDPVANFKIFHAYYENKLSTNSYIKSAKYLNHEQLLAQTQLEEYQKQQESALFAQFESITISEIKQIDDSIESMLNQLSLSEPSPPKQNLFNPIAINQAPDESAYRKMAMQFLRLAQSHIQNKLITHAIQTYVQVIDVLESIPEPNQSDVQIIQNLREHIVFLKTKPHDSKNQFSSPTFTAEQLNSRSIALAPVLGLFGHCPDQPANIEGSMNYSMEMELEEESGLSL